MAQAGTCPDRLRTIGLCLVAIVPLATAVVAQPAQESVVARAFVPSPARRVGEVRLLRRGTEQVVQTLLYTTLLQRVVLEIAAKEEANWPPESAGRPDAVSYLETLRAAEQAIPRPRAGAPGADRTRRLLIEFRSGADGGTVLFATFEAEGPRSDLRVRAGERLGQIDVSRHYAERNMGLIAADAFGVPLSEVDRLWGGARIPER
jgi:hypothetical protein